jgi:hypothetical protein
MVADFGVEFFFALLPAEPVDFYRSHSRFRVISCWLFFA